MAAVAAVAAAAIVAVVLLNRGEGPAGTGTTASTSTAPAASTAPATPPAPPEVAPSGDFAGAPPDVATPPGGSAEVTPVPGGGSELTVSRADGSPVAVVGVSPAGDPVDARYYDRAGRLTVVVDALRAAGAGSGPGALVRCGSAAHADAGYRWTRFPIRWRLSSTARPARLTRAAALGAIRRARGVWNGTRSHCRGLRDASRARFAYAGSTPRRLGRDGTSTVDTGSIAALGGVCPGAVACTITWIVGGGRAIESDTRIAGTDPGGFSVARRPGARRLDLQSVMVHESGHTLGFAHVSARDVVMFPVVRRGGVSGRLLGRGDAVASNQKY